MTNKRKKPFGILAESIGLYFSHFDKFIKYMTFPVIGQIFGVVLVFCTTYFYSLNISKLVDKYPMLNDFWILVGIVILLALPGMAIFCKAFWEYLVAYGAVNSMLENLLKSGRVYDFDAHTELIKRRTLPFIGLWFLFGIFSIVAVCPLFWIICGVFAVYFVLTFQIFTFEPELSPLGCVKKSMALIKGHFASTFFLLAVIGVITYLLIPQVILTAIDSIGITTLLTRLVLPFVSLIEIPEFLLNIPRMVPLTHVDIAKSVIEITVAQILIQYSLPMRSILWSLWYKELNNGLPHIDGLKSVTSKRKSKRPSEKLMENSHKKFSKKKLDDNIIKRAMEKDDEEE